MLCLAVSLPLMIIFFFIIFLLFTCGIPSFVRYKCINVFQFYLLHVGSYVKRHLGL